MEQRECKRQAHIEIWASWKLCILGCDIVGFGNFLLTDCCQVGSQLCWLHGFILCSNFDATFPLPQYLLASPSHCSVRPPIKQDQNSRRQEKQGDCYAHATTQ